MTVIPTANDVVVVPGSHLDLFWLGDYRECLRRGDAVIRSFLDRLVQHTDETFVIDTAIFAEHFLATHPGYRSTVIDLLDQQRLQIGAAFIDRWENLVLGESLIRNVQIGRAAIRSALGVETDLAAHPDLPGLNAQTSQIYAQAGITAYVTSRKLFHEGRVWLHRAPDGTELLFLSWPVHYVFVPLDDRGLRTGAAGHFIGEHRLSHADLAERYPHGTVAVSGSSGDLTDVDDFARRYAAPLRTYVEEYNRRGAFHVRYGVPATVLGPYLSDPVALPVVQGSIPSVWGVAPDEEMRFFGRARALERALLDGETASVIAMLDDRPALPPSSRSWRGLYGEDAFFHDDDPPPPGREWEWLWRMHVFTQDHNGGGQDGALSTFQKRVRHDRAARYAAEVFDHAAGRPGDSPLILTFRADTNSEMLVVDAEDAERLTRLGIEHERYAVPDGPPRAIVPVAPRRGVGLVPLAPASIRAVPIEVHERSELVDLQTPGLRVEVHRAAGTIGVTDEATGAKWSLLGRLAAVRETGNDVTLRTDESSQVEASLVSVDVVSRGRLLTQLRIVQELLGARWPLVVSVWHDRPSIDIELAVQWPALPDWQIRLPVLDLPKDRVHLGTAFHHSAWTEVPAEARPFMIDEISSADFAEYREVQHWLRLGGDGAAITLTTLHPAFRHDGTALSAVLLRTPASCGDPRFHWLNPGRTSWAFRFHLEPDQPVETSAHTADRDWRAPRLVWGTASQPQTVLETRGDPVLLSALTPDPDDAVLVRLVNASAASADVLLDGVLVRRHRRVHRVDLRGVELGPDLADGPVIGVRLEPWRIATFRFSGRRSASPTIATEGGQ